MAEATLGGGVASADLDQECSKPGGAGCLQVRGVEGLAGSHKCLWPDAADSSMRPLGKGGRPLNNIKPR